jgi:hypothetical protein
MAQWVRSLDLTTHTSLSPIRRGFVPGFVNYKKGCTRLAAASDKVYQLLAHGWWFPLGTPAFSSIKTGRRYYSVNRLVWVVRSSDLTHWAIRASNTIRQQYSEDKYFRSLPAIFIFSSQKYASPRLTTGWWMLSSFHPTDLRVFFCYCRTMKIN